MTSQMQRAIDFAIANETKWSRDPGAEGSIWGIHAADPPPWNRLLGPVSPRGPACGLVMRAGELLAQWGEPQRPDLTFSIAKTYLALLAGVAFDSGLLPEPDEPVVARVRGIGFDDGNNRRVTWTQLLQQTSEWQGSCFGVPDQVDRFRVTQYQPDPPAGARKGEPRPLREPGTWWEYNDIRINQLSLALLHLFRRPLPDVFRERIMRPIGASDTWRWDGYENSWVEIDGRRMQSVPGGTHWGGGVTIHAFDQLRIGRLLLERGRFDGAQVVSGEWIDRMLRPCPIAPFYGYLVWLNNGRRIYPSASETSFFAIGAGSSYTWVDPQREAVVIVRWLDAARADTLFGLIGEALDAG
ncbi:MAG TPA: serine hydrolase [Burkholderiaceae bacterium]|nr:serine hydrolase [Burkholderiaceae bacterium]